MIEKESVGSLLIQQLKMINSFANRLAPVLALFFLLLTLADGLHVFKCGWFWTSLGTLFCLLAYFAGRNKQSIWQGTIGLLLLVIGLSAGITPFVATLLVLNR